MTHIEPGVASNVVATARLVDGREALYSKAIARTQLDPANLAAIAKAETLAKAVESRPATWNGSTFDVRVAFGVHTFFGAEPVDETLHAADRAMYARKKDPTTPREAA